MKVLLIAVAWLLAGIVPSHAGVEARQVLSVKVLPIKNASDRTKLWATLSRQSEEMLIVRPMQSLEDAIRARCGSAPPDLVSRALAMNPGQKSAPEAGTRQFRFLACPYWNFGSKGKLPSVHVATGQSLDAVLNQAMGSNGPQKVAQIRTLNPELKTDKNGIVLQSGAVVVPYIVRNLRVTLSPSQDARNVSSQIMLTLPAQTRQIAEEHGAAISPGEYSLIAGDVSVSDSRRDCGMPDDASAWPFNIDRVVKAIIDTRQRLAEPPSRTSLVVLADTGVLLNDSEILASLWQNEAVVNGFQSSAVFKNDMHGASMATLSGDSTEISPSSDYKFSTHGTDVARILIEPSHRRKPPLPLLKIAVAKLNDQDSPYRIGLNAVPNAMDYAREIGADALSLSVMISKAPPELKQELATATFLVVAAAGNDGTWLDERQIFPPGLTTGRENMIVVGAHDWSGKLSSFSNKGMLVDIAAPGCGIPVRSVGGAIQVISGTSFAVPFVTFAAAQLRSVGVPLRPARLKQRLIVSGTYTPALAPPITHYGVRLDIERAIRVKEDSVMFRGGSTPEYGALDMNQNLTCTTDAGVKNYRLANVLKVVAIPGTKNSFEIWSGGPDGDSIDEFQCPNGFDGPGLRFQRPGDVALATYPWSDVVDVVPRYH